MKLGATISFSLVSTWVSGLRLAVVDAKRRPCGGKQEIKFQTLKKKKKIKSNADNRANTIQNHAACKS